MEPCRDEIIATHEASHAAIHNFYNHDLEHVEIGPDSGHCKLAKRWEALASHDDVNSLIQHEFALQQLIAACAGKAGVNKLGYRSKSNKNWRESSDFKRAFKHALRLGGGDYEAAELLVAFGERMATILIERMWPQVNRLTLALLEYEKLSGEDVHDLLGSNGSE